MLIRDLVFSSTETMWRYAKIGNIVVATPSELNTKNFGYYWMKLGLGLADGVWRARLDEFEAQMLLDYYLTKYPLEK